MTELEPFCFWCGGNARYEFQTAPRPFYEDKHRLCASCAYMRGDGIMLFELTETDPGCNNPKIPGAEVYYTGRWVVINDRTAAKIFPPERLVGVVTTRVAGLRADHYAQAGLDKFRWGSVH